MFRSSVVGAIALLATLGMSVAGANANIIVSDYNDNKIESYDALGNGSVFASGSPLGGPGGLAMDASGNIYTANYNTGTVSKITPQGVATTFATGFNKPWGLAFDNSGNLYVANAGGNTISKVTSGGIASTFATGLSEPEDLAYQNSILYVANYSSGVVSEINSSGVITPFASVPTPVGLVFDSSGDLFVSSNPAIVPPIHGTGFIDEVTPGGVVSTFITLPLINNDPLRPYGMAFDPSGNLFVAVSTSTVGSVIEIKPDATYTTFASINPTDVMYVPEPTFLGLFALSSALLLIRRRVAKQG